VKLKIEEVTGGYTGHCAYFQYSEYAGQAKTKKGAMTDLMRKIDKKRVEKMREMQKLDDLWHKAQDQFHKLSENS
jgi:hypothetical protein